MVRSIIETEDGVAPPINTLLIQLEHQLPEVNLHDLISGVYLSESKIDIPQSIHGNNHRDSWM